MLAPLLLPLPPGRMQYIPTKTPAFYSLQSVNLKSNGTLNLNIWLPH
jgi:hypothetical protein